MSEVPFDVTEEVVIEDLSAVKEQKSLVPVTPKLRVKIAKASVQKSKGGDIKSLKLEVRIVDGIEVSDKETGAVEVKYKNKPMFTGMMDLVVWADLTVKNRGNSEWWKTRQYQVELRKFLSALGYDPKSPPKINDDFFAVIADQEVLVDVTHEEESIKRVNENIGHEEYVGTGVFRERLRNWSKA